MNRNARSAIPDAMRDHFATKRVVYIRWGQECVFRRRVAVLRQEEEEGEGRVKQNEEHSMENEGGYVGE